jgi:hypothetical protein
MTHPVGYDVSRVFAGPGHSRRIASFPYAHTVSVGERLPLTKMDKETPRWGNRGVRREGSTLDAGIGVRKQRVSCFYCRQSSGYRLVTVDYLRAPRMSDLPGNVKAT